VQFKRSNSVRLGERGDGLNMLLWVSRVDRVLVSVFKMSNQGN